MAGTINFAMTQQFDIDGEPLSGGLLYFFEASTTNPQSAFQDIALTIAHPNPIVLDASGRVPMFYLEDGNIKIRLTDENGVTVIAADNLLVIGPSTGGSGGAGVDPNTVLQAGDIKARFGTGTLDGFVRCNGRTIGAALSSATERANADCQSLFEYLWSTTVLSVEPVRGVSANGDWLANARIALPDLRGRTISGLDDMGATAASRLTSTAFGASATVLGNAGGTQSTTLSANQLPTHTHAIGGSTGPQSADHSHTGTTNNNNQNLNHTHGFSAVTSTPGTAAVTSGGGVAQSPMPNPSFQQTDGSGDLPHTHGFSTGGVSVNHSHTLPANTGNNTTTALATPTVPPAIVMTFYIKL